MMNITFRGITYTARGPLDVLVLSICLTNGFPVPDTLRAA
jgi:hypothetical protein